ncbi:2740_t:CDS:2, partial [Gigaspora margarita]
KIEEHEASIESNEMLEEGRTPLEIFRANKDKIPYCRDYGSMYYLSVYNINHFKCNDLKKWLIKKTENEKEEYFKNLFAQIFYKKFEVMRENIRYNIPTRRYPFTFILIGDLTKSYNIVSKIYGNVFEFVNTYCQLYKAKYTNVYKKEKLPLMVSEFVKKDLKDYFTGFFDGYSERKLYFLLTQYNFDEWEKKFGKLDEGEKQSFKWRIECAIVLNFQTKSEEESQEMFREKLVKISTMNESSDDK